MIRTNKEQKTALSFLIISKAFERLAFYMVIAILVFYLTETFKMKTDKAGEFYSLFYGSVGISTFIFGWLGDLFNRQKLVKFGMVFMTVFYLVLIFLPVTYILQLIVFIVLGISIGMTISNTIVFLGNIYNEQKAQTYGLAGFIFYSLAISFGAFLAPTISNIIRETIGYMPIFILAFIFALISLVLYLLFDKSYSKLELFAEQRKNYEPKYKNFNLTILISIFVIGIILKMVMFQKGLTLNNYIRDYVINGHDFASRLHNIDKFISILLLALFGIIVVKLKKLNWNILFRLIIIGAITGSIVYIVFAFIGDNAGEKISSVFTLNMYSILLVSETLIYSIMFYTIYRVSPIKYKGLFQGLSLLIVSISNILISVGIILYEKVGSSLTFIAFSLLFVIGGVLVLILMIFVKRKEKELIEIDI